jgi:hypothetical protein
MKTLPQVSIQTTLGAVTGEYLTVTPDQMEGVIIVNAHPPGPPEEYEDCVKEVLEQCKVLFPKAKDIWVTTSINMKINAIDPEVIADGGEYLIGISGDDECVDKLETDMKAHSKFADAIKFYRAK